MFKFIGKLTRLGCDATVDTLNGILEIPGDIVEGYKEGFKSSKEKVKTAVEKPKIAEIKAVKTRKKTPKTVAVKAARTVPTKKIATTRARTTKVT